MRQMLAILTQPDRTHRLRSLRVPALVVHGMADKMVHVSGGRSTAAAIPGAELRADRRDGPRPAARPLRDPRRGDRADGRPGVVDPPRPRFPRLGGETRTSSGRCTAQKFETRRNKSSVSLLSDSAARRRRAPASAVAVKRRRLAEARVGEGTAYGVARRRRRRPSGTSPMTQPPNPPPVIRAPSAPADEQRLDGRVDLGHGDPEVVAHRGVRGGQGLADVGQPALVEQPGDARGRARPRSRRGGRSAQLVVVEPAERVGEVVARHVAQGRDAQLPSGLLAAAAAGAVLAVGVLVRRLGVDDEDGQPVAGEVERARPACRGCACRRSRTCPASPRRLTSWSIPPVGAPTASFSTSRVSAKTASSSRPRPRWSSTARTTEQTRAADDDRPAPVGTSESTVISIGGTSTPRSVSSQSAPST